MTRLRAHPAERIDRSRTLCFTFAGREFSAFDGDTVGSALHAAGVRILSRSFKYHRPRGLLCCAGRCPSCLVNVDGVPNVRACLTPAHDGMRVRPQHAWPSVERDVLEVFDRLHRLLPVGFYYKTFIHPRALWPTYERVLRRCAGLGEIAVPGEPPGDYECEHGFADVAVVGGGPAGIAAALEASVGGAEVVLVDDQPRLGGRWPLGPASASRDLVAGLVAELHASRGIRVLTDATAFGLYEDGLVGVLQGRRFVKLRARAVVVGTGAFEYPGVFENNDLPGVMLGSAVERLRALYGVKAGERAVVIASGDRGLELARDLLDLGVEVAGVADARPDADSSLVAEIRQRGVRVFRGATVLGAIGPRRVRGALLGGAERGEGAHEIACDLICLADRSEPAAGLIGQAGGRLRPDAAGRLVPAELPGGVFAGGEVVGSKGLLAILTTGRLAGAQAALSLAGGGRLGARVAELRAAAEAETTRGAARPRPVPSAPREAAKKLVCLCEDVTEKDLRQAIAEGFDHIETLKRYTTVTMGPCQGKMCHRSSIELCAAMTGRSLETTGTTTARPPLQPVPLGALAARYAEPVKLTPMHHLHVAHGARLMDMGQWKRPLVYSSVEEECRAVREAVGLIDVSTLGKLDLKGRDAGEFLDWLHPNRFSNLPPGRVRYRLMCDEGGIILDDGVVARLGADHYLMTTATGTIDAVEQWLEWWLAGSGRCLHVTNVTGALGAINVAGPRARDLLGPLTDADLSPAAFPYMTARRADVAGVSCTLLRIGFVGEIAWELYFPADYGEYLWGILLEAGASLGVRPFGVEAQRVLRLEKQHVIVAQDTDALTTPLDANLGALVRLEKPDFIGREALVAARARAAGQRLVGFELREAATPPAEGAAATDNGRLIGRVSSAKWSPTLGAVIGLAWVPADRAREGASFDVRLDGRAVRATVVTRPFYDPDGQRLTS